jgi:hypothetical protein
MDWQTCLGFQLWLILYLVTPFLVPWLWWRNRAAGPETPEAGDLVVPMPIRWLTGLIGALFLAATALFFLWPSLAIRIGAVVIYTSLEARRRAAVNV